EARRADGTAEPARAPRGHPRGALRCGGSLSRRCRQSDAAAHRARPGGPVPRGGGGAGAVPSEGTAGRGGPGERRGTREVRRRRRRTASKQDRQKRAADAAAGQGARRFGGARAAMEVAGRHCYG
ncbi:unnamed protein product, partial [Prorocentrum cordatum]